MIQRFLITAIVGFLVLTSQIADAEDYDWSQAPRIGTKAELARCIENERRRGQTKINFVLINFKLSMDEKIAPKELRRLQDEYFPFASAPEAILIGDRGTGQLTYVIKKEYPGTRVANAYLSGNTSNLTMGEQTLYNIAVEIVNETNKRSSEVEKARYIHDEICKRVEYRSQTNPDAIGALVIGITNCQGFTDAFYMLGRMCGLNVCRIEGSYQGETHVWNFITFSNGKSYCVDVTHDDNTNSDNWFLKTRAHMEKTHSCEWEIIPNLQ